MIYSARPAVDAAYRVIAVQYVDHEQPDWAMTFADALIELGEARSWASVWWAYGAVHYDLSDESLERALELLPSVDASPAATAAALMLQAEISMTDAIHRDRDPDHDEQHALLARAVKLAPEWPELHLRLARAAVAVGDDAGAARHARLVRELYRRHPPSNDPFDVAFTGLGLLRENVLTELTRLGLPE
ncbi:MAG TPA: hypothetical protein VHF89_02245 [Solirubrobacteraceae bacterium]|nr:hypothetical protein [Solirubrobacteraceae bacterium]